MRHLEYKKVGLNRDMSRVWLQGKRLADCGLAPGVHYEVAYDPDSRSIKITLDDSGSRTVVKRKRYGRIIPIIDLNNPDVTALFGNVERIRVLYSTNHVQISIDPNEIAKNNRLQRLRDKLLQGKPLDIGSTCSGIGALDRAVHQGLADRGIKSRLAFANELEGRYLEANMLNNPIWDSDSISIEGPMQDVELDLLPEADIFIAGLRCEGASRQGLAKNGNTYPEEHPEAGDLFVTALQFIKHLNPACVLFENVPLYEKSVSMIVIRSYLKKLGYSIHETILNGNELGALEMRKRFCMVAVTEGLYFDFSGLAPVRSKEKTLSEILDDVPADDPSWKEYTYLVDKAVRDREAGKNFTLNTATGKSSWYSALGKGYGKVRSSELKILHPEDPKLMRQATPAEHARGKTIPEEMIAGCSPTLAHEVLGQSVIYSAFHAVGRLIGNTFLRIFGDILAPHLAVAA